MKDPIIQTEVVHSTSKPEWKVLGTSLGKKHKIAVVPYVEGSAFARKEAEEHADFISFCFNNSKAICKS
jgi:hypothetical protein